jgi:hypothetical protein
MQLKDTTVADKSFAESKAKAKSIAKAKESDTQTLATETSALIRKIRRHIEADNCDHCRNILSDNKEDKEGLARPPSKPASAGATQPNPGRVRSITTCYSAA